MMKNSTTQRTKTITERVADGAKTQSPVAKPADAATTPEELADVYLKLKAAKKDVETEIEIIETALRSYVNDTGELVIGQLQAYRKNKPAALVLISEKYDLTRQKEALMAELEDTVYIKRSLDVTGIHKAAPYEKQVERTLLKCKLATVQEEEWYFK